MLLAVDIGNTETVFGLYEGGTGRSISRIPTERRSTPDLLTVIIGRHLIERPGSAFISSVVPPLNPVWEEFLSADYGLDPVVLGPESIPGMEILIDRPREAGTDRIINSWMGRRRYGAPLIVVDFGTATTFDVVDKDGAYIGGAIAAGVGISVSALAAKAALLPPIDPGLPSCPIGRNTEEALRSGLVLGHISMVEGMLGRIRGVIGDSARAVATGGHSRIFKDSGLFDAMDPRLTIDGVAEVGLEILTRNR